MGDFFINQGDLEVRNCRKITQPFEILEFAVGYVANLLMIHDIEFISDMIFDVH